MPVIEGLVGDPWERTLPACPCLSDVEPVPLCGTLPGERREILAGFGRIFGLVVQRSVFIGVRLWFRWGKGASRSHALVPDSLSLVPACIAATERRVDSLQGG